MFFQRKKKLRKERIWIGISTGWKCIIHIEKKKLEHTHTFHSSLMRFRVIVITVFCLYGRAHAHALANTFSFVNHFFRSVSVIKAYKHCTGSVYTLTVLQFARKISYSIFYAATQFTGNNNNTHTVSFIDLGISNVTLELCVDCSLSSLTVMDKKHWRERVREGERAPE